MTPSLQLQSIHLRVPDLARSVDFYSGRLGFVVKRRTPESADLSTTPETPAILKLSVTQATPPPRDAAGLFHAALLLPSRGALARWLQFAAAHGIEFDGFSDHGVSEAIYLSDPDGNGLEIYADRPRDTWPIRDGELAMDTKALALPDLLAEPSPPAGPLLEGARWGHLHLRVTNLERSEAFYRPTLGMEVTQRSYPGARFLAADGYHHHLGINTWGNPDRPQPPGALGLADATFARAGLTANTTVTDPDGVTLRLVRP